MSSLINLVYIPKLPKMFEHYIYMGGTGGGDLPRVTMCKKGEFLK